MDIQQQTKNVAAQGRFGDSMLLHVNPEEVKGLASAMPITINPETGQPEAFLPFLAPMLGSLLGPTILGGALGAGTAAGLSSAALSGIGAGLASYAQSGSLKQGLISGLTAGLGGKALEGVAQGVPTEVTTTPPPVDPSFVGPPPLPDTITLPPITSDTLPIDTGKRLFSQGFDEGVTNIAKAAATPTGMIAGTLAGTGAVMQSQEEFAKQMAQMEEEEEERKKRMYAMYPEQIPVATGGTTNFANGGISNPRADYINRVKGRGRSTRFDNIPDKIDYSAPEYSQPFLAPRARIANTIPFGFMPGFMPEFSYFQNLNPTATAITGDSVNIDDDSGRGRGRQRGIQQQVMPNFGRFNPMFGGFNPFMQSSSYRNFYGAPQMRQTINPYASFDRQFFQPPVNIPPPIDIPPPNLPEVIGSGNVGRKGRVESEEPTIPTEPFENQDMMGTISLDRLPAPTFLPTPTPTPAPTITIPIEGGRDVKIPDFSKITPPNLRENFMSIERIDDNFNDVIPQQTSTNPPQINETTVMQPRTPSVPIPSTPAPSIPQSLQNVPQSPMFMGNQNLERNPRRDNIFAAPMFAEGKNTDKELPNEGLKALAKTEKGREAIEAMGYQKGEDINMPMPTGQSTNMMMQDPIVQETIQFILGETDNNEIINEFIVKYGQEQLMMLRNMVLAQAAGNPDVQTEGLIKGNGNSGMADDLPMNIGNKPIAAVSQDEYIIPADVVSMLGDGSSDAGSKQLDAFLDKVRTEKTGTTKQAKPLDTDKVLPV